MSISSKKIRNLLMISIFLIMVLVLLVTSAFSSKKVAEYVVVEAGQKMPEISEFIIDIKSSGTFITDISTINMDIPGTYDIEIQISKKKYSTKLEIKDTIAPIAEVVNHEIWPEETIEANAFVKDIVDVTDVIVFFKEQPDYTKIGQHDVPIILEDTSGNKTELISTLIIKADIEPPIINGVKDHTIFIGEKMSYKKDVTVTDNRDENVDLVIDSSAVNLKIAGSYNVNYTATDISGNSITETVTITVKEKPKDFITEEDLNKLVDQVLSKIVNEGMTEVEKAWAIYKWTRNHITYSGTSDKTNWIKEAYRGIQKATGDCFTSYATSKALLTRAGFENILVNRDTNTSYHSWNLVKIGGEWYHYDATNTRIGYYYVGFLRTDEEVLEYSKESIDYMKFDQSKYPASATVPLEHPRKLR